MIKFRNIAVALCMLTLPLMAQENVETHRQYLSGHGCDDMVQWQFYCTGGQNSGKWTTIGVPSCWELQGFGTYQYGMRFYGIKNPPGIANEKGLYKYEFTLPEAWRNRQIELVFEAKGRLGQAPGRLLPVHLRRQRPHKLRQDEECPGGRGEQGECQRPGEYG